MSTDTKVLDVEDVRAILHEIITEYGEDYVYRPPVRKGCVYQEGGQPSCIIGHLLHRVGLLSKVSEGSTPKRWGHGNPDLAAHFTPEALRLMNYIQEHQDGLVPWGEALRRAEADLCEALRRAEAGL